MGGVLGDVHRVEGGPMRMSYYGWCCAKGCEEEATARAQIGVGDCPPFLVPVCGEHLLRISAEVAALQGHDLGVQVEER